MSLFMIRQLRIIKKHDRVLFNFCQVRRDAIGILREKNLNIPKKEYTALRHILEILNMTIHNYDEMKASFFNVRSRFFKSIKEFAKNREQIEQIDIPDNQDIVDIYNKFGCALLFAFFSYTPFIKSELCLKLAIFLLKAAGQLFKKQVDIYIQTLIQIKNQSRKLGFPLRAI